MTHMTERLERDEAQTDLVKVILSLPTGKGERAAGAVEGVKMMRARLEAELIAAHRKLEAAERLVDALQACVASIEHADMSDGVCCCGDDMETHSEPMSCGHSPVDAGEYHAHRVIQSARTALAAWDATTPGWVKIYLDRPDVHC